MVIAHFVYVMTYQYPVFYRLASLRMHIVGVQTVYAVIFTGKSTNGNPNRRFGVVDPPDFLDIAWLRYLY